MLGQHFGSIVYFGSYKLLWSPSNDDSEEGRAVEEAAPHVFARSCGYEYKRCCLGADGALRVVRLLLGRVLAALAPVPVRDAAGSQRH